MLRKLYQNERTTDINELVLTVEVTGEEEPNTLHDEGQVKEAMNAMRKGKPPTYDGS